MLISDWSSDVCSSDLSESARKPNAGAGLRTIGTPDSTIVPRLIARYLARLIARHHSQVFPKLSPCRLRHGPERQQLHAVRSEERRVGKACVSPCRYRWSPYHSKKKTQHKYKQSIIINTK